MSTHLMHMALVIPDYDDAIAYFTQVLGFSLLADEPREAGKRWVVVAPNTSTTSCSLLLARAVNAEQTSRVGNQTGGRVFLFLHTDDFWRDYHVYQARGVHFIESPRIEPYGTVVVFEDPYGNRWDLLQMNPKKEANAQGNAREMNF